MILDVAIVNKAGQRVEGLYEDVRTLTMQVLFDGLREFEMPLDREYVLIHRTTVLIPEQTLYAGKVENHAVLVIRERSEYPG